MGVDTAQGLGKADTSEKANPPRPKKRQRHRAIEESLAKGSLVKQKNGPVSALYWTWTTFTLAPAVSPTTMPGKILVMGYMLCNFLIIAVYTAVLASYLTVQHVTPTQFDSLSQLGPGKMVDYNQICIPFLGSSIDHYWYTSYPVGFSSLPPFLFCSLY